MIHPIEFQRLVAQQQGDVLAHLHHGPEIGASQTVAVEPELHAPEPAVDLRVEPHDADIGVGQRGTVVEPLGVAPEISTR